MRRAVITIEWDGPDKAVREWLDDKLDGVFEDMTYAFENRITYATSGIEFTSKVKP